MNSFLTRNFRSSLSEIKSKVQPVTKWSRVTDWGLCLTRLVYERGEEEKEPAVPTIADLCTERKVPELLQRYFRKNHYCALR